MEYYVVSKSEELADQRRSAWERREKFAGFSVGTIHWRVGGSP